MWFIILPQLLSLKALIALDAEKARTEWNGIAFVLEKFGFGVKFISCVKLLYASLQASVRTNGTNSRNFRIYRSTRQGCLFSPLLCALVMEPLAIALRSHPDLCGITRNGVEVKIALYADCIRLIALSI